MPTVIDTSTASTATAYSNQRKIDRCQNGVLWAVYAPNATDGTASTQYPFTAQYSLDDGVTWTRPNLSDGGLVANGSGGTNFSHVPNGSLFIDADDFAHIVFKDNSDGFIYYRRGTPNAARTTWTWSAATLVGGATAFDYPDVVAHQEGSGWVVHVVASRRSSVSRARYGRLSVSSGGSVTVVDGLSTDLNASGYGTVDTWPSIDFNHTGDDKTVAGSTPHLYVAWSAGATGSGLGIRFKKATYSGGSWTWGTEREIDNARYVPSAAYFINCLFDGTRVLIGGMTSTGSSSDLVLYERDVSDTTTTPYILDTGLINGTFVAYGSMTYTNTDVYFFGNAFQSSPFDIRKTIWSRATSSHTDEYLVSYSRYDKNISCKRGYSNGHVEFIYTDGSASPYSVTYDSISVNTAPNAPTLVAPANATYADLASGYTFDWTLNDSDAGDSQSAYAFRRRVNGTSTYEYWNAATASWQAAEVKNATGTTQVAFGAGKWSNGTTYDWSVKTWDAADAEGTYAADFVVTGNTVPALATPTPADGAFVDLSKAVTFDAAYSDPDSNPVGDVFLRRQWLDGTIEWWDGAAWQTSEVAVSGGSLPLTVPAGAFTENAYRWSMAVTDSAGAQTAYTAWHRINHASQFVRVAGSWVGVSGGM